MVFREASFDEAIRLYTCYCKARGLAERTIRTYSSALEQLRASLAHPEEPCPLPRREDLRSFTTWLLSEGYARSTISIRMRAIRAFGGFLKREGILDTNPMDGVPIPKVPISYPEVLSTEEMARLLKAARTRTWHGTRNHAVIAMFCDTGLRLSELISLDVEDVDLNALSVRVRRGKGGKERHGYIGHMLARALRRWIEIRPFAAGSVAFFCTTNGRRLDKRNVARIIDRVAGRAGFGNRRVHPHMLRHTFATHYIQNGGDPFSLQRILGHSDIKTTMIYVNLAGVGLQEAHAKASPVDRMLSR